MKLDSLSKENHVLHNVSSPNWTNPTAVQWEIITYQQANPKNNHIYFVHTSVSRHFVHSLHRLICDPGCFMKGKVKVRGLSIMPWSIVGGGGLDINLCAFLTAALSGGKCYVSGYPESPPPRTQWTEGWVGPRADMEFAVKRTFLATAGNRSPPFWNYM
jgi:hypothetical protein